MQPLVLQLGFHTGTLLYDGVEKKKYFVNLTTRYSESKDVVRIRKKRRQNNDLEFVVLFSTSRILFVSLSNFSLMNCRNS